MLKKPVPASLKPADASSSPTAAVEARRLLLPLTSSMGRGRIAKVMSMEEEEDLAGDLIEGAASRDSRRNAAKRRHESQQKRYLNEAVATAVADLYLVQSEIDIHYFHIGQALHKVEKRRATLRRSLGGLPPLETDLAAQLRSGIEDDGALARRTEDSNEAFKSYLRAKAKGSWELKTTVELVLQSTTSSSLDAAAAQSIRNIMHQDRLAAGGKQAAAKAAKDIAGEKIHNSNPYDFSFKTLSHLAKVDEQVLNTKVRVGAPSHLLFDNKEHPLMYVAERAGADDQQGAQPVTAAGREEANPEGGEVYEGATTHTLVLLQKHLFMKTNELARVGHVATVLGYGWVGAAERASDLERFPSLITSEVLAALQHGRASSQPLWQEVGARCTGPLPNHIQPGAKTGVTCGNVADVLTTYHSMGPVPEQPDALFADDEILLAAAAAGVNLGKGSLSSSSTQEKQGGGGPSMKTETAARLQVSRMRGQMRQQAGAVNKDASIVPEPSPPTRIPKRRALLSKQDSRPPSTSQSAAVRCVSTTNSETLLIPPPPKQPSEHENVPPQELPSLPHSEESSDDSGTVAPTTDFLLNRGNKKLRKAKAREEREQKKHEIIAAARLKYRPYEKRELLADRVRRERAATPSKDHLPMVALSSHFDNSQLDRVRRGDTVQLGVAADVLPEVVAPVGDPEDDICWGLPNEERPSSPLLPNAQSSTREVPATYPQSHRRPFSVTEEAAAEMKEKLAAQSREIFDLRQSLNGERLKTAALQREVGRADRKLTLYQAIQRHLADVNEISTLCELGCTAAAAALLGELPENPDEPTSDLLAAIKYEYLNVIAPTSESPTSLASPTPSLLGASVMECATGHLPEVDGEAKTGGKKGPQFALAVSKRNSLPAEFQQRLPVTSLGGILRKNGGSHLLLYSGGVFGALLKEYPFGRLMALQGQRVHKEQAAALPRRASSRSRMSMVDPPLLPHIPGMAMPHPEAIRILDNIVVNGEQLAGDRRAALSEFLTERRRGMGGASPKSSQIEILTPPASTKKQTAAQIKKGLQDAAAAHRRIQDEALAAAASQPHPYDSLSPRSVALSKKVKELLDGVAVRGVSEGATFSGLSLAQQEAKVSDWCQQYTSSPHLRNIVKVQNALLEVLVGALVAKSPSPHAAASDSPVKELTMLPHD